MPQAATPALALLARAGVPHRMHTYEVPSREGRDRATRPSYGLDAAAALGVAPERVFKTLIATVDDRLAVAIVPVVGELDLKALAASLGGRRAALADGPAAERASGSVVGGISPLGLRRPLPTAIDRSATAHDTILVSAGRRGLEVELAPADLIALINAVVADLVKGV